jgi:short-subunit dehydrogenase
MAEKQVVFITGASSGIGRATALAFARRGWCVAGTARDKARLEELQAQIPDLLPLSVDVRDAAAVQRAVAETAQHFGRLDVLIANAGVGHRGGVVDSEWDDVETLLRTNIDGVLHSIRAAVPVMREQGGGHIVTVSSIVHNMTVPYAAYYAASKAFVSSMARSLRLELNDDHIHVTDMILGRTDTNFDRRRMGGTRSGGSIPSMAPEQVAQGIVQAVAHKKRTAALRWLDRLIVLANVLVPSVVGRVAKRQYK